MMRASDSQIEREHGFLALHLGASRELDAGLESRFLSLFPSLYFTVKFIPKVIKQVLLELLEAVLTYCSPIRQMS
jgi:hypothetical protein